MSMNRRQFTKNALITSAALSVSQAFVHGISLQPQSRQLKKGIMWGSIGYGNSIMDKFNAALNAGFDGVEVMSNMNRSEVLQAKKATGLPIPSVCGADHWKYPLSDPDSAVREKGLNALKLAIEDAAEYGANTVLLVPGRVSDTVAYDDCWKRSSEMIAKALPLAEKLKIRVAFENVWNNFLLSPMEAASFVDQFRSVSAGFYFDCGNILNYGWPEQWIHILGNRIAKVHIKEFSRQIADKQGKGAGFGVKLLEGDVNWKAVMKAFDDIGYHDWTTIEQPGGDTPEGLKDLCDRLKKIHTA